MVYRGNSIGLPVQGFLFAGLGGLRCFGFVWVVSGGVLGFIVVVWLVWLWLLWFGVAKAAAILCVLLCGDFSSGGLV